METLRVDIAYRPLRIAWAIHSGDREAFRKAVRLNHTMWGGRFNPIVLADRPYAQDLVKLFRADFIVALGDSQEVATLKAAFLHLPSPLHPDSLFFPAQQRHDRKEKIPGRARVLDLQNAFVHWRNVGFWERLKEIPLRRLKWDDADPLGDIFLIEHGGFPAPEEVGEIDYWRALTDARLPENISELVINPGTPIPQEYAESAGPSPLTRMGFSRHYSVRAHWDFPGVFLGDATNIDDVATFWNVRAADVAVRFIDVHRLDRYGVVRPIYDTQLQSLISGREGPGGNIAIWTTEAAPDALVKEFYPAGGVTICRLDDWSWRGGGLVPPTMILGEEVALGVIGQRTERPSVSFAFNNKPFANDRWFYPQHLVASVVIRGPFGDHDNTFSLPHIPPLNEFYARSMGISYDDLRVEPERIGLITNVTSHDMNLTALSNWDLVEGILERLCAVTPSLSNGGLIARQLIAQIGGLESARPFKIPGVRRLLKTGGFRDSVSWSKAMQLIAHDDPDNPGAHFRDHQDLYIEQRPIGSKLEPKMVFTYLVETGLYRIGFDLICPTCRLPSWVPLDEAKQGAKCELCGAQYDATRQLVGGPFMFRRSGVLGIEKNSQGAVPVVLLLQQLSVNLGLLSGDRAFLPSIDLKPEVGDKWEIDFLILSNRVHFGETKTEVIIGECKDRGNQIDYTDIENLHKTAMAFPKEFFDVYFLLSKLSSFTEEELVLAKTLNDRHGPRVILLTDRELEPYMIYERTERDLGLADLHAGTPKDLAISTMQIYPILKMMHDLPE